MKNSEIIKRLSYFIMPFIGTVFLLWYVKAAGADAVYSDYIRIIAQYLPDVGDIRKLLVPDVLTRIPATFLERYINVRAFSYSVTFDRVLGVIGIAMMAVVLAVYFMKYEISFKWQAAVFLVLFSLTKWEIILNGTAWAHIMSFGLFFVNYYIADRMWRGETLAREELLLCVMPVMLLLIAGEYIVSYCVTMILVSIFGILMGGVNSWAVKRGRRMFRAILITTVVSLCIYVLSRHFAVWEHSGATEAGLLEVIQKEPFFIVRFLLKSFAGAVIGQETIANFFGPGAALNDAIVIFIGIVILAAYVFAFFIYIESELFEETVFPLVLLISGFGNHLLVALGRWIFLKENYALSSRYAGQFMIGLIGMLLIFAMYGRRKQALKRFDKSTQSFMRAAAIAGTVLIISGNCYTTYQELIKAPYREENYVRMGEAMLQYEDYDTDELKRILEWTKDDETMYKALSILKNNRLNVFSHN